MRPKYDVCFVQQGKKISIIAVLADELILLIFHWKQDMVGIYISFHKQKDLLGVNSCRSARQTFILVTKPI